jgi:hypothetical protein
MTIMAVGDRIRARREAQPDRAVGDGGETRAASRFDAVS